MLGQTQNGKPSGEALRASPQLVKRIGWNEVRINAIDDDDAYLIREALSVL